MTTFAYPAAPRSKRRRPSRATELMRPNPVSFDRRISIPRAEALLHVHGLDAAPMVDELGRLAGVVTAEACAAWQEFSLRSSPFGLVPDHLDSTPVAEIASPVVETVLDGAPMPEVIEQLVGQRGRRLYVVNELNELVGVVSRSDVPRHLMADCDR